MHKFSTAPKLQIVPVDQASAKAFIEEHHRHRGSPVGSKFQIAAADKEGIVRGVAVVGRPVARHLDDGWTLEITRVATDGTKNVCSMLYAACWRVARAMGYRKLSTYTLKSEPGTSLMAAGWTVVGEVTARSWHCESRPRVDKYPLQEKLRWEIGGLNE
jgi:hypothetical protein